MKRKKKAMTPNEAHGRKLAVWKHNSFFGHVAMMKAQCVNMIASDTTSNTAKTCCEQILVILPSLVTALLDRREGK